MSKLLEGVDPDDCDDLKEATGETTAFIQERRDKLKSELSKDDPDWDTVEDIQEDLESMPEVQDRLRKALSSACGLGYYPTEDYEGDIDCDDMEEWHETLDEMQDDVGGSVPEYIIDGDIGFDDEASLEHDKQTFFGHAESAKSAIERSADARDCDGDFEAEAPNPVGPKTVVCKHPDPEDRAACMAKYGGRNTHATGLTKSGEVYSSEINPQ